MFTSENLKIGLAILASLSILGRYIYYGYRDDYRHDPKKFISTLTGLGALALIYALIRPLKSYLMEPVWEWVTQLFA